MNSLILSYNYRVYPLFQSHWGSIIGKAIRTFKDKRVAKI